MPETSSIGSLSSLGTNYSQSEKDEEQKKKPFMNSVFDALNGFNTSNVSHAGGSVTSASTRI